MYFDGVAFGDITAQVLSAKDAWLFNVMCALAVHLVYNKHEVPPSNFAATAVLLIGVPILPAYFLTPHIVPEKIWISTSAAFASFYVILLLSITAYRVSPIHPLARFPGPPLARVSQLWAALLTAGGKRHQYLKILHDRYGPYVRIGPNELSCIDASAIPDILGPGGLPKGPIWDARSVPGNMRSLIALRDPTEHHRRRRLWNRALSSTAVKEYEDTLQQRAFILVEELEKRSISKDTMVDRELEARAQINLTLWMSYFAFDFMGDMAFGGGFNLLKDGDTNGIRHSLESGLKEISLMQYVPWLTDLLWKVPALISERVKFVTFSINLVKERVKNGSQKRDLFHFLIDEDNLEPVKPPLSQIVSDAMLAVLAGSDTTATTLSSIFFYLLTHDDAYGRLRAEIDAVFSPEEVDPTDSSKLADLPYLNAVISEGLRLQPSLPTNIQRATAQGSTGAQIGTTHIPGGTAINVPTYSLHRSASYFAPYPCAFWPDRWLKAESRLVQLPVDVRGNDSTNGGGSSVRTLTNTAAFIPFSFGPANCAGKNLAMLEMRMIVALIMSRFDMYLVGDYDPEDWDREQEDYFAMKNGRLPVVVKRRE